MQSLSWDGGCYEEPTEVKKSSPKVGMVNISNMDFDKDSASSNSILSSTGSTQRRKNIDIFKSPTSSLMGIDNDSDMNYDRTGSSSSSTLTSIASLDDTKSIDSSESLAYSSMDVVFHLLRRTSKMGLQ